MVNDDLFKNKGHIYFDAVTQTTGCGIRYGEFSINGRPLYDESANQRSVREWLDWWESAERSSAPETPREEGGGGKRVSASGDRTLTCRDCGQEFTFTAGEQEFYAQRGFSDPQRCPACRQARKSQRNQGGYSSSGYGDGGSYSSGGYGDGSYSGSSGYSSGPRRLYPAICSQCGKETQMPFAPRSDKPVYCRECFQARRAFPRSRSGGATDPPIK